MSDIVPAERQAGASGEFGGIVSASISEANLLGRMELLPVQPDYQPTLPVFDVLVEKDVRRRGPVLAVGRSVVR